MADLILTPLTSWRAMVGHATGSPHVLDRLAALREVEERVHVELGLLERRRQELLEFLSEIDRKKSRL